MSGLVIYVLVSLAFSILLSRDGPVAACTPDWVQTHYYGYDNYYRQASDSGSFAIAWVAAMVMMAIEVGILVASVERSQYTGALIMLFLLVAVYPVAWIFTQLHLYRLLWGEKEPRLKQKLINAISEKGQVRAHAAMPLAMISIVFPLAALVAFLIRAISKINETSKGLPFVLRVFNNRSKLK